MYRSIAALLLTALVGMSSLGCVQTCKSCSGYWRNQGKPGHFPVGKACCRKCDLCDDVGGPCGLWSQTSGGGCSSCGNNTVIEEYVQPTAYDQRYPQAPPVYSQHATHIAGRQRR